MDTDTRDAVGKALRREVPDRLWESLLNHGYLDDASFQDDPVEFLVGVIREQREDLRLGPRKGGDITPDSRRLEAELRGAAAAYLAERDGEVASFRADHLDGLVLSVDEAEAWLIQEASAAQTLRCPSRFLRRLSVRLAGSLVPVLVCSEGLARLSDLAERLSSRYSWPASDAAGLALTGDAPPPVLASGSFAPSSIFPVISLRVSASLTQDEVGRAFESLRGSLAGVDRGSKRPRRSGDRNLEVALFALSRVPASWAAMQAAWNDIHPDRPYGSRRNFQRDASQGLGQVLPGSYRMTSSGIEERTRVGETT